MKKILKNELYRAFINKKMLTVLLIESIFILIYTMSKVYPVYAGTYANHLLSLDTGKPAAYLPGALYMWIGLRHSSFSVILFAIVPLLAAIPYGDSLFMDEESHYINHFCIRSDKKAYYWSKLTGMFLSGGIIAIFPFVLSFVLNTILLPIEPVQVSSGAFPSWTNVFSNVFYWNPLVYIFIYLLELFIVFGLLNCFCFVVSDLMSNRFVVTIVPFTIYFASGLIGNFTEPSMMPWVYTKMQDMNKSVVWIVVLQIILIINIIVGACCYKSSRKTDVL